jgi:hypothetical protein
MPSPPDRGRSTSAADVSAAAMGMRSVRRQSDYEYLGMPLWSIAMGPDPAKGELRGHAKGVLAIGDTATGIVAIGGLARGFLAIGGLAIGIVAVGGLALGGVAMGGLAIAIVALGGGAVGWVAVGGAAAGFYAAGGAAWGTYILSAVERSPEAIAFFAQWDVLRALVPASALRR